MQVETIPREEFHPLGDNNNVRGDNSKKSTQNSTQLA